MHLLLDKHELSITPIPESINDDDDENIDQRESSRSQVRTKDLNSTSSKMRKAHQFLFCFYPNIVNQIKNRNKFSSSLSKISHSHVSFFCFCYGLRSSISVDSMNLYLSKGKDACLHICLSIFSYILLITSFCPVLSNASIVLALGNILKRQTKSVCVCFPLTNDKQKEIFDFRCLLCSLVSHWNCSKYCWSFMLIACHSFCFFFLVGLVLFFFFFFFSRRHWALLPDDEY